MTVNNKTQVYAKGIMPSENWIMIINAMILVPSLLSSLKLGQGRVLVRDPSAPLLILLPTNAPDQAGDDGSSA